MKTTEIAAYVWENGIPFLTNPAIDYMESVIKSQFSVFEWGAGGSTIWLAKRVSKVVSVEHQRGWYDRVASRLLSEKLGNVELFLIPHRPPQPYADAITYYPQTHFDLVLVDGRERVRCIKKAADRIRPAGYLVLDNSERLRYGEGIVALESWKRLDFKGRWITSVFIKPDE